MSQEEDFPGQRREHRREEIIRKAVFVADRIILEGSDGSNEETNFLTAQVAKRFIEKALMPFSSDLAKKDLFNR
jgi:hypothetical protein